MPNFDPAKPFGEKFNTDNDTQAGFVSLFAELAMSDSPPQGEDLISELKDTLTPMYLIHPEISKKLPIYGKVKTFLERYGVQVPVTEESGTLVARRLICRIWSEPEFYEDRMEAFQAFELFRLKKNSATSTLFQQSTPLTTNATSSPANNSRQISNDVAKRFSNEKSKFSGESNECWSKFEEAYTRMSIEMELSNELKKKFFHHLLRDHALEFYRDYIEQKATNYEEVVKMMNDEFCSSVKMESVARKLQNLHISQYEKDEKSEEEALTDLAKDIQDLCPQAPPECRTDRFRKNILYSSTKGRDWALNISSSTNFLNLSYQQLLHEFQNSLQQYKIHNDYGQGSDDEISYRASRISETNFIGQGKYINKYHKQGQQKKQTRLNKCWNCGKVNCNVKICPHPKNPNKIRLNRIKHFEAKNGRLESGVAETLFQFCEAYFGESDSSDSEVEDEENMDTTAAEIQHTLAQNIDHHRDKNKHQDDLGF